MSLFQNCPLYNFLNAMHRSVVAAHIYLQNNQVQKMEGEIDNQVFISVKEEPLIISDEDENFDSCSHGGGRAAMELEELRGDGPPPFLKKTFEMVDDVQTDSIISWSCKTAGASFVVWDSHKLCTHLLPKYFKHNNFSSFVRQLNTYRFRKIDPDRWEFANEGFQQGKKHLLKHIKRRKQTSQKGASQDHTNIDAELAKLRNDQIMLRTQLSNLRHQQQDALYRLASVQERLHVTETKQKHMLVFLIKTLKNPMFMIDKMKKRRAIRNCRVLKRRRLDEKCFQDDQDLVIESEISSVGQSETTFETSSFDVLSENFVLWEKLMEDDMIYEDEQRENVKKQSDIVSELEDLIAKPPPEGMVESTTEL